MLEMPTNDFSVSDKKKNPTQRLSGNRGNFNEKRGIKYVY